jgi:hypothetical protein
MYVTSVHGRLSTQSGTSANIVYIEGIALERK